MNKVMITSLSLLFYHATYCMKTSKVLTQKQRKTFDQRYKKIEQPSQEFRGLEKKLKNAILAITDTQNYQLLFIPNVPLKAAYSFMKILTPFINVYKHRNAVCFDNDAPITPAIEATKEVPENPKQNIFFMRLQERDFKPSFQNDQLAQAKKELSKHNQSINKGIRLVLYLHHYNPTIQKRRMPQDIEVLNLQPYIQQLMSICPIFLADEHFNNFAIKDYDFLLKKVKLLPYNEQKRIIHHLKALKSRQRAKRSREIIEPDISSSMQSQLIPCPKKNKLNINTDLLEQYKVNTSQFTLTQQYVGAPPQEMIDFINFIKNPEKYDSVLPNQYRNLLLHGPPGTGKTLLSKIAAQEAGALCFKVDHTLFNKWFRQSANNMGSFLKQAHLLAKKENKKVLLIIDEADSFLMKRFDFNTHQENRNITNAFITGIDELYHAKAPVFVVAITNKLDYIDEATKSRFPVIIETKLPDYQQREKIFTFHLQNRNKAKNIEKYLTLFANKTSNFSARDIFSVINEAAKQAARENSDNPCIEKKHILQAIQNHNKHIDDMPDTIKMCYG